MARFSAGDLDRRIIIQKATEARDAAGDVVPGAWVVVGKLWANRKPGVIGTESAAPQGQLRQHDLVWSVRANCISREIFPETHRIFYKGRIHEVVGVIDGDQREDLIKILTCTRPDGRGDRGRENVSGI